MGNIVSRFVEARLGRVWMFGFALAFLLGIGLLVRRTTAQEQEVPRPGSAPTALSPTPAPTATPAPAQPVTPTGEVPRPGMMPTGEVPRPGTTPTGEVPRPGTMPTGEIPRPGAETPALPTAPSGEVARPAAAPAPSALSAAKPAEHAAVDRELLSSKVCGLTCHFNSQFGAQIAAFDEEMLVKINFVTSGPANLARPRPADYRQKIMISEGNYYRSAHGRMECIDCHKDIVKLPHPQYLEPVKCESCHAAEHRQWTAGNHGVAFGNGNPDAPDCARCHGNYHEMAPSSSTLSPIHKINIHAVCASCHANSGVLERNPHLKKDAVETWSKTIHGEGVLLSGMPGSATCSDCHGPHKVLPHTDLASSTSLYQSAFTCGVCHIHNATSFSKSIHGERLFAMTPVGATTAPAAAQLPWVNDGKTSASTAPGCWSCHPGHGVMRINTAAFQLESDKTCGACHPEQLKTYRETYHGKIGHYGGTETARCHDCHGYHDIRQTTSPLAMVSPQRIVETCKVCHPYSNEKFTQFISHLDVHDKSHPQTYYAYLFMTLLLIGTMGFFTVHSLFWLFRELVDLGKRKHGTEGGPTYRIQRFNLQHRLTHAILFISVIGLAVTGLPLRYPAPQWTQWIFDLFGGHMVPRVLHRVFAALTLVYAGMHFVYLWNLWRRAPKRPWLQVIFGPNSMVPNWNDVVQFFQHCFWMIGLAKMPKFGRWTYWEKFDYWAVFWGVTIIGSTGLIMALPAVTAQLFPGWIFNVALIIHSDEALLAASFLFAIHFFHVHLRPAKFPLDHVIFTGSMTRAEMEVERPLELAQLEAEGKLESLRAPEPNPTHLAVNRWIAAITLTLGLLLLAGMFYTEIIGRLR